MKKFFFIATLVVASFIGANAQTGNNQIGIAFDAGIPTGDFGKAFKTGFGGYVKGLLGVGTAGQATLTVGYTSYKEKNNTGFDMKSSILPILAGYRQNFSGFYVEPQAGYGSYGSKVTINGTESSGSDGAFTWAVGLGFAKSGVDLGARYQSGTKSGSSISVIGLHLGYNFSLGGGATSSK